MNFEESADNKEYFCKANVDFLSIYDVLVWSQQIPTLLSNILFPTPIFFSEFWTFKLSHLKGFHTQDLILIYMVYLCPKNLHEHFGQAERVGTWSKCLIFSGAQLSNSQLWRGVEKNQNMFWKAQTSADVWLTKIESSLKKLRQKSQKSISDQNLKKGSSWESFRARNPNCV